MAAAAISCEQLKEKHSATKNLSSQRDFFSLYWLLSLKIDEGILGRTRRNPHIAEMIEAVRALNTARFGLSAKTSRMIPKSRF